MVSEAMNTVYKWASINVEFRSCQSATLAFAVFFFFFFFWLCRVWILNLQSSQTLILILFQWLQSKNYTQQMRRSVETK